MAMKLNAPDWVPAFLDALASGLGVNAAAAAAGIVKATAYNRRRADPEFCRRWDDAKARGSGKPRKPTDVAVDALQAIATDETKPDNIRISAARELRVADRFAGRPKEESGAGGQDAPAEVSEETRRVLREAEISAWVSTLTMTAYMPAGLEWSRGEWAAFAELVWPEQEAVLAEARALAPARVIADIEMIIGGSVDDVLTSEPPST